MIVLGLDPGETTGYVVLRFEEGNDLPAEVLRVGEVDMWIGLERLFLEFQPDQVACEAFRLYPWMAKTKTWNTFPTVEVIGVIKYLAQKYGVPVKMQNASMKKACRKSPKHPSPHVKDAARHALIWWHRAENRRRR